MLNPRPVLPVQSIPIASTKPLHLTCPNRAAVEPCRSSLQTSQCRWSYGPPGAQTRCLKIFFFQRETVAGFVTFFTFANTSQFPFYRCTFTIFQLQLGIGALSQKIRMMVLPSRERSLTISLAVWIQYTNVTDRQTDGRTDRRTDGQCMPTARPHNVARIKMQRHGEVIRLAKATPLRCVKIVSTCRAAVVS